MTDDQKRLLALGREYNKLFIFAITELRYVFDSLEGPLADKDIESLREDVAQALHGMESYSVAEFFTHLGDINDDE